MTRRTWWILLLAALVACSGEEEAASETETGGSETTVGPLREAPDFSLETLDGDMLTLADFDSSEAILMNFWASWCYPCKTEMPQIVAIYEAYKDQGLAVLGVTVNDLPRDSRNFMEEMRLPYPSVIGTPAMLEAYGLSPWLPTTLLVQDGAIVREWIGPQTRADFEYPVRVAVGLAPPIQDVIRRDTTDARR